MKPHTLSSIPVARFRKTHLQLLVVLPLLAIISCNHSDHATLSRSGANELLDRMNELRASQSVGPLTYHRELEESATRRAEALAADGAAGDDEDTQHRLVSAGLYARFALSCTVRASDGATALTEVTRNPLHAGKVSHGGVTHAGAGMARSRDGRSILVVDMARIVPPASLTTVADDLLQSINARRARIGAPPLQKEAALQAAAEQVVADFMAGRDSSDSLIQKTQNELAASNMDLGRITIAFQVAGSAEEIIVPERTMDPRAAYVAIGIRQGNHPDHDPGSLATAILLASPQNLTAPTKNTTLPPPRAMPQGHRSTGGGSLVDQAWVATLAGNHKKAARLFASAHRKHKEPELLYEQARAHARNGDMTAALKAMREFEQATPSEPRKEEARQAIAKLSSGESIFSASKEEQLSVEARRFFLLGQKLFSEGQWQGAIDAFGQAFAYAPHPDFIYNIGLAHLRAGHVGDALDFFQEYQRLVPEAESIDQARQLFELGIELYSIGQFDAAARRFTMAYGHLPLKEVLYNLALCHIAMGDNDEARRILADLIDKAETDAERKDYRTLQDTLGKAP